VALRNPLAGMRPITSGILTLTAFWTVFQILDHDDPPAVLDQILVAVFGIWFAAEAKRNSDQRKRASDDADSE